MNRKVVWVVVGVIFLFIIKPNLNYDPHPNPPTPNPNGTLNTTIPRNEPGDNGKENTPKQNQSHSSSDSLKGDKLNISDAIPEKINGYMKMREVKVERVILHPFLSSIETDIEREIKEITGKDLEILLT